MTDKSVFLGAASENDEAIKLFNEMCRAHMEIVDKYREELGPAVQKSAEREPEIEGHEHAFIIGLLVKALVSTVFSVAERVHHNYDADPADLAQQFIAAAIRSELSDGRTLLN